MTNPTASPNSQLIQALDILKALPQQHLNAALLTVIVMLGRQKNGSGSRVALEAISAEVLDDLYPWLRQHFPGNVANLDILTEE